MSYDNMDKKERDQIDDLFRDRLHDWEADIEPAAWDAIADRLPQKARVVSLPRLFRYGVAAAVALLLVLVSGIYFGREKIQPVAKTEVSPVVREEVPVSAPADTVLPAEVSVASARPVVLPARLLAVAEPWEVGDEEGDYAMMPSPIPEASNKTLKLMRKVDTQQDRNVSPSVSERKQEGGKAKPSRKWGFGMGAGGFSVGSANTIQGSVLKNANVNEAQLDLFNAASNNNLSTNTPKTNVRHKTPVSFSVGVSRYLADRWSLQTGLSYSFLVSEWTTNGVYRGETKQKLHFLGIPLSVVYRIAEWNRLQIYAAAGGMAEVNLTGTSTTTLYSGTENLGRVRDRVRMHEWYWSVNARAGVSYPLFRFLSAYAEVGAAYYFDNGSDIETVHSDKPFNVSFDLGLRLGF